MIKLDFQSRTPIYMQLQKGVCELILLGQLEESEPLPSVRTLARDLGINPNTIQKAYQELESGGVIVSSPGRGSFAAEPSMARRWLFSACIEKLEAAIREARHAGMSRGDLEEIIHRVYQ